MMPKLKVKFLQILIPTVATFFIISCSSVQNIQSYGYDSTGFSIAEYGAIKEYKKNELYSSNDIIYKGKFSNKFDGLWNFFFSNDELIVWEGEVAFLNTTHKPQISYYKERITTENPNNPDEIDTEIVSLYDISIKAESSLYRFDDFSIEDDIAERLYRLKSTPVLATFYIGTIQFSLVITSIEEIQFTDEPFTFLGGYSTSAIGLPEQIFQIIDETGMVFAEFTHNSYKIYDASTEFDEAILIPCIAYYSIIIDAASDF